MDPNKTKSASEGIAPMGITSLNETVLSNQPESRYECPVCLNWLRDPVITTCGHKFCKSCITSWLQFACYLLNMEKIFSHVSSLMAVLQSRQPMLSDALDVVEVPTDEDTGCFLMNAYSEIKINNDISNASIDTKEQEAMNLWEAPDKEGAQAAAPLTNTSTLIRALYERVVVLEQRNREQDIVLANLTKQLSALAVAKMKQNSDMLLRYCAGNYIWRVDNFQQRLDAMLKDNYKMLYSPGFYTSPNGYRFCVRLNISPQNSLFFALHVHLMKTENDDCLEWPFNGRISFAMINQLDAERTQRDTMMSNSNLVAFQKPSAEICLRGFGYTEYALISDVVRNGFVKNDVLVIKVTIKCV
ncbi:TNF receptor-associated factor 6 [Papilio machaon]|uniref:TNF receptor-associated factor 6 n=1 Tax=Papilio machaon TaxID=76193 RepID=A0A194QZX3_PAPMA|nr:TNF receptor-associated factor 6 [Papilio machaon]